MIQLINLTKQELMEPIDNLSNQVRELKDLVNSLLTAPKAEVQAKNSDYNGFVSRQEVMEELRLSPSGIYQVTQKHGIVGKRIGKKIYYKRSDIDKLFEN